MARKKIEQGFNQLTLTQDSFAEQEHTSYMAEVVSVPDYKQSKKRWQCMVKLLPDLWEQERNELCFVLAQKQASLDANKLTLLPGDVVKIGGVSIGKQSIRLQGGRDVSIERFSLTHISVFSRAPRLQLLPQTMPNGSRRLLA